MIDRVNEAPGCALAGLASFCAGAALAAGQVQGSAALSLLGGLGLAASVVVGVARLRWHAYEALEGPVGADAALPAGPVADEVRAVETRLRDARTRSEPGGRTTVEGRHRGDQVTVTFESDRPDLLPGARRAGAPGPRGGPGERGLEAAAR